MWRRYNPNPRHLMVGDCTVRAITAACDVDWYTAHRDLCELSREMANMPSADVVWHEFLRTCGFRGQEMIDQCPDCYTVADFAADHPRGTFVLGPREHAVCCINGDWWDSWDSGRTVPTFFLRRD